MDQHREREPTGAVLDRNADEIAELCRRYGVARLEVFGSAARAEDFDAVRSDVDVLVAFADAASDAPLAQVFGLAREVEAALGRPVDLVEAGAVKNPYLRETIERSRRLVYAA
jgi:predicted nucleotidyltransferase